MSVSTRDKLIQACIRDSGLCALIVATDKHGGCRILCKTVVGVTPHAARGRRGRVEHWRVWLANQAGARKIAKLVRAEFASGAIATSAQARTVIVDLCQRRNVQYFSDEHVIARAAMTVDYVESLVGNRLRLVKTDKRLHRRELFLTLHAAIQQLFYKPLFYQ